MAKMGKVLDMAGKVISEGVETAARNTDDIAKAVSKNSDDIAKALSNKSAKESASVFMKSAEDKVIESIMKMESVDRASAKSILRNEKKVSKAVERDARNLGEFANPSKVKDASDTFKTKFILEDATKAKQSLRSEAIESLVKDGFDPADFTDEHIDNKIKELRKNRKYERVNISETRGEQELKNRLKKESSDPIMQNSRPTTSETNINNDLKGSTPNTTPAPNHKELKNSRYDSADSYMKYKQSQQYEEVLSAFDKKDFENPLLKELNINRNTTMDEVQGLRTAAINSANKKDMGFTDMMGYHKVPQIATGVAGTAWLVNKMAASSGQQTNSQLYGQTPY